MNIVPLGPASMSGAPLAQPRAAESTAQHQAAAAERADRAAQRATQAGGIHAAEAESETRERDADGRRLWELPDQSQTEKQQPQPPARARDPHGTAGQHLDLTG